MSVDTYVVSATGKRTITKDPNAILDYTWDWAAWLDDIADTISTTVITVTGNLTVVSTTIIGKTVVGYISGGTAGETQSATCRIVTNAAKPRTEDRTIFLKIKER